MTITTERTALARDLRDEVLACLHARQGEWVPVADLLPLAPAAASLGCTGITSGRASDGSLIARPGRQALAAALAGLQRDLLAEVTLPLAYRLYDPDGPVGLEEIVARLGVKRVTADTWRTRKNLPEPTWPSVGGRPAWRWQVIRDWAIETGRYPGGPNTPRWRGSRDSVDDVAACLRRLDAQSA